MSNSPGQVFWDLTRYIGRDAEEQRTIHPFGLIEVPRRAAIVAVIASVVWIPVCLLVFSWLSPYDWAIAVIFIALTTWAFVVRTEGLRIYQYKRIAALAKSRSNEPITRSGSRASTSDDDVRFLIQSWTTAAKNYTPITAEHRTVPAAPKRRAADMSLLDGEPMELQGRHAFTHTVDADGDGIWETTDRR